jgi:hypothetical protein
MVPAEHSALGTALEVQRPEGTVAAIVTDRVFFKPEQAEQQLGTGSPSSDG